MECSSLSVIYYTIEMTATITINIINIIKVHGYEENLMAQHALLGNWERAFTAFVVVQGGVGRGLKPLAVHKVADTVFTNHSSN